MAVKSFTKRVIFFTTMVINRPTLGLGGFRGGEIWEIVTPVVAPVLPRPVWRKGGLCGWCPILPSYHICLATTFAASRKGPFEGVTPG